MLQIDTAIQAFKERSPLILDNSSMDLWMLCHRKFLYRVILQAVKPPKSPPLAFGNAFHAALHSYYSGQPFKECMRAFVLAAKEEQDVIQTYRANADKTEYSLEFGMDLLSKYIAAHPIDMENFVVLGTNDKPYLEMGFSIDVDGGVVVGKMDGIVRMNRNAHVYVLEHKTTGKSLNIEYLARFTPHNQLLTYLWSILCLLEEMPRGVLVNIIRVKDYKRGNPRDTDQRLFARLEVTPHPDQIYQRVRQIEHTFRELQIALKVGLDGFTQNAPNACNCWGRCEYDILCNAQLDHLIEMILHGGAYRTEVWTPYDELKAVKEVVMVEGDRARLTSVEEIVAR